MHFYQSYNQKCLSRDEHGQVQLVCYTAQNLRHVFVRPEMNKEMSCYKLKDLWSTTGGIIHHSSSLKILIVHSHDWLRSEFIPLKESWKVSIIGFPLQRIQILPWKTLMLWWTTIIRHLNKVDNSWIDLFPRKVTYSIKHIHCIMHGNIKLKNWLYHIEKKPNE